MEAAPDMDCLLDEIEEVIASEALKENRIPSRHHQEPVNKPAPYVLPPLPLDLVASEEVEYVEEVKDNCSGSEGANTLVDLTESNTNYERPVDSPEPEVNILSAKLSLDAVVPIEESATKSWLEEETHTHVNSNGDESLPVVNVPVTEDSNIEAAKEASEYDDVLKYLDECEGDQAEDLENTSEEHESTSSETEEVETVAMEVESILDNSDSLLEAAHTLAKSIIEDVTLDVVERLCSENDDDHTSDKECIEETDEEPSTPETEDVELTQEDEIIDDATADVHEEAIQAETTPSENETDRPDIEQDQDADSLAQPEEDEASRSVEVTTEEYPTFEEYDNVVENVFEDSLCAPVYMEEDNDDKDSALQESSNNEPEESAEEDVVEESVQSMNSQDETSDNEQNEPTASEELTTVHVLPSDEHDHEEDSGRRLTESELMVGKVKPHWIPDSDCTCCMLCSLKFSLLLRRHHCRACGRLLCAACCSEREILPYMVETGKKAVPERVCMPCAVTLRRITEHESRRDSIENEGPVDETNRRGVLKSRPQEENVVDAEAGPSQGEAVDKKRTVRFRDGVQPGCSTNGHTELEKSTAMKPKKKSRKRSSVVRRIAELRIEDELISALPEISEGYYLHIKPDGIMEAVYSDYLVKRLADGSTVSIILKKNLYCVISIEEDGNDSHWCVSSRGFDFVGLDELVFVWKKEPDEKIKVPISVLHKISEIFCSSFDLEKSGVRPVAQRMPSLFSQAEESYPLTKHTYFFKPTSQKLPYTSLPDSSFLVACFVLDEELPWITAMPNRVLLSLGLKYGVYPTPIVNYPKREPVVDMDPNNSILKVFTDFRKWRYRITHILGSTISLSEDKSVITIPRIAADEIRSIIESNSSMIAWSCDTNNLADSHLCCKENDGVCQTHILSRESNTTLTGASFVVIDGGLKSTDAGEAVVNMIEDGICIRMQAEAFNNLKECFTSDTARNFSLKTHSTELIIRWTEEFENLSDYVVRSDIDGMVLESKYQYGLSLDRAISSSLEFASVPDAAVRLSHVYNLREGRLSPVDEPRVFSVVEMIARETTAYLDPYFRLLLNMNIRNMSIRIDANSESVEYTLSTWVGLEDEQAKFRQSMDELIPILYNVMAYLPNGINLEMKLSFVSTRSLPIESY